MYVVAYLNLHDGYLQQFIVTAPNRREAMCEVIIEQCFLKHKLDPEQEAPQLPSLTEREIYSFVADMDAYIHAVEV